MTMMHTPSERLSSRPENGESFQYPYASKLAQQVRVCRELGITIDEYHAPGVDLDEVFRSTKAPILEVGGPTEAGYYFLNNRVLPFRPVVGNLKDKYSDGDPIEGVEILIDGRELPFGDESLGLVLSAHLPKYDIHEPSLQLLSGLERSKSMRFSLIQADTAMQKIAKTGLVTDAAREASVRLAIAEEVYDKLVPGGVYITDGEDFEVEAYKKLGYDVIASFDDAALVAITGDDESYYYVVLRKPEAIQ